MVREAVALITSALGGEPNVGKESDQGGHQGSDESKRIATAGIFEAPGSLK